MMLPVSSFLCRVPSFFLHHILNHIGIVNLTKFSIIIF